MIANVSPDNRTPFLPHLAAWFLRINVRAMCAWCASAPPRVMLPPYSSDEVLAMSKVIERAPARPPMTPARLGRFLWGVLWTPFWVGSTLPPPALPGRREALPAADARTPLILRQIDGLRETIWRQRRAIFGFRGLWLALLAVDIWLGLRVLAGRDLSPRPFLIVALAVVAFAAFLIAIARPSRGQMARTLDRSFGLRERLTTALEEAQAGRPVGLRALQILDATRVTRHVATATAFCPHLPAREIAAALATGTFCLVLLIMLLLQHFGATGGGAGAGAGQRPGAGAGQGAGNAPGAQSGSQAGDQTGQQPGQNGQAGQNGQQGGGQQGSGQPTAQGKADLNAVAGALQDHAATSDAGDKLASGDYAGAAEAIREAGGNAAQTSPQERQAIANDVRNAADQVGDPQLASDLRDVANGLTQPNAAGAQRAFDRVANDVERTAQGGQPGDTGQEGQQGQQGQNGPQNGNGGSGAGTGNGVSPQLPSGQRQSPAASSAPLLGADGKPIELPKDDPSGQSITTQGQQGRTDGPGDPGAAGAGGGTVQQGTVGEAGVDTNQVPYDQRGTIERYFTPNSDDGR